MWWTQSCSKRRMIIAVLAIQMAGLPGCSRGTPLSMLIREDAPGYHQRLPATGDPGLGKRVMENGPESGGACYQGALTETASWGRRTLRYGSASSTDLKTDLGTTLLIATGGASVRQSIEVSLLDVKVVTIADGSLFIDPTGPCATNDSLRSDYAAAKGGKVDEVVTDALKATGIEVSQESAATATLIVDVKKVGGTLTHDTSGASTWTGTNLYLADRSRRLRATQTTYPECKAFAGRGKGCDFGICTFSVSGLDLDANPPVWAGNLSCQGGENIQMQGKFGQWAGTNVGSGSYSLLVNQGNATGSVVVKPVRWDVINEG